MNSAALAAELPDDPALVGIEEARPIVERVLTARDAESLLAQFAKIPVAYQMPLAPRWMS